MPARRAPRRPPPQQQHNSTANVEPKPIGELRRSMAASMFGPGAIADFRTPSGAPVSVVMAGLDEWAGHSGGHDDTVHDPRLERLLNVDGFRLPPVPKGIIDAQTRRLPAVRFPKWLQCPKCHVIGPAANWTYEDAKADRWCPACTGPRGPRGRVYVVPVRFVVACDHGHIDDFPWNMWAQHKAECTQRNRLRLVQDAAGLAGLNLECCGCGMKRSMSQAFERSLLDSLTCSGRRPWLRGDRETCDRRIQTVQRGASNLYFPVEASSLLIPPWDDDVEERLGPYWPDVLDVIPEKREAYVARLIERRRITIPPDTAPDLFARKAAAQAAKRDGNRTTDLRGEEWEQFAFGGGAPSREFEVHPETVPSEIVTHVSHVVRAVRLREIRALRGFTRITPPGPSLEGEGAHLAAISRTPFPWLPAVEVRGEGVFLSLAEPRVAAWESLSGVQARATRLNHARRDEHRSRFGPDVELPPDLPARYLLVHALAHALMRQLSLECGYSTASLRERLYAGAGMAGLMIYTSTTDADGTLGGLQRQGEAARIARTLRDAIEAQRWCSSDPLCIRDLMMVSNASNLAACHACLLAPETSCEEFNRYLDRALLVGTPEDPSIGFFSEWL